VVDNEDIMDLNSLTEKIFKGYRINKKDASALLKSDVLELMPYADRIRKRFKGIGVNLCSIINAKSGLCAEDCSFCAQSVKFRTGVSRYPFVGIDAIVSSMKKAVAGGATCFSIVTSGNTLKPAELDSVCRAFGKMKKAARGVTISVSIGKVDEGSLRELKKNGLMRFHHNLETAKSYFGKICSTHKYEDRVATVRNAKNAGLEVCSGGIIGLGESPRQRVDLAFELRELGVDRVPVNFLNPIPGTPLGGIGRLSPLDALKAISLFRFILPDKDISVCGGREAVLGDMQSWIFYAGANGMMIGGYLTTIGRSVEADIKMIKDQGLKI